MSFATRIKAVLEKTTLSGSAWVKAKRPAGNWQIAYGLLDKVYPPENQIWLAVPIIDRYRRSQATVNQTPSFYMIVDWVEHPYRFEVDGVPIGTFISHDGGSDGSVVEGVCPTLTKGIHIIQGFEDTHMVCSVPTQFLVQ